MMFKSNWKLIFIQIFAPNGFLVWWLRLNFQAFAACRGIYMTAERAVIISGNLAIWTVHVWEKIFFQCFWVPGEVNVRFRSKTQWNMFPLVSGRHVGAHLEGHQHGVSIQISNLVLRVSLLCLPWSLEERPWFGWSCDHPEVWVAKKSIGSGGWQSICLLTWQTLWVSNHDHLAVAKNYSFYRGSKPNLPMKDAARFLPFLKYRRLPFTKKFGSRMEQKQVPNRSETSSGSVFWIFWIRR